MSLHHLSFIDRSSSFTRRYDGTVLSENTLIVIVAALSGFLVIGSVGILLCIVWRRSGGVASRTTNAKQSAILTVRTPRFTPHDAEKGSVYFLHGPLVPIPEEDVVLTFKSGASSLTNAAASGQHAIEIALPPMLDGITKFR